MIFSLKIIDDTLIVHKNFKIFLFWHFQLLHAMTHVYAHMLSIKFDLVGKELNYTLKKHEFNSSCQCKGFVSG